ncbi:MAG: YciI family protein [Actinobacteria bacterium]|nr:YciI family protein [Actinomycetota bacterium]MCI0678555.1 YciI family protein [Actinomycetota bacterium]
MTQYLMSVYYVEGEPYPDPDVIAEIYRDVDTLNEKMKAGGVWVFGGGLHTPDTATVVRQVDGETLITDGPFPEAKEQIGGFWIIDAADLDGALAWAAEATVACRAPVEVRPFQDEPEV